MLRIVLSVQLAAAITKDEIAKRKELIDFKLPLTPEGEAALKYNLTKTIDTESICIIGGTPRHNASGLHFTVLQGPKNLAFLYFYSRGPARSFRMVRVDTPTPHRCHRYRLSQRSDSIPSLPIGSYDLIVEACAIHSDPKTKMCVDDPEADWLSTRAYRKPFVVLEKAQLNS